LVDGSRWPVTFLILLLGLFLPPASFAQTVPEEPTRNSIERYRVRLWIAYEAAPEIGLVADDKFRSDLGRSLKAIFGGAWDMQMSAAPPGIGAILPGDTAPLTVQQLKALADGIDDVGKLIVVGIGWNGKEYEVQSREFDARAQVWSISRTHRIGAPSELLSVTLGAIVQTFAPVGTIGKPNKNRVEVALHAGEYSSASEWMGPDGRRIGSPLVPQPGSLMQVIIRRRNPRSAEQRYSYSVIPWTILQVNGTQQGESTCTIHSGLRSPLRVRGVSRTDRLAIAIQPRFPQTTLKILSNDEPQRPLSGYQVYAKEIDSKSSRYVGQSDWRGEVALPRDDESPLKFYYLKHGKLLLKRLPIVAGHERELVVEIQDDSQRLRAEGAVKGIQDRLVDSLVRREIKAARIRRQLESRPLDASRISRARELLKEYRELPGRNEFIREIQDRQREFFSGDKSTQNRIDRLFRDVRDSITRSLTTTLEESLVQEIQEVEQRMTRQPANRDPVD
jgi:hypothetical protein